MTKKTQIKTGKYKIADGSFRYYVDVFDPKQTPKRMRRRGFISNEDAYEVGRRFLNGDKFEENCSTGAGSFTYEQMAEEWLRVCCRNGYISYGTLVHYEKRLNNQIFPSIGKLTLDNITYSVLQNLITDLYNKGFGKYALGNIKGILSKSFDYAIKESKYGLEKSPATRLSTPFHMVPDTPTRTAPHTYIPREVFGEIYERFPSGHPSYLPLRIAEETGMRMGEVYGLCEEDFDPERNLLYVNRQVQWYADNTRTILEKRAKNGTTERGEGYWFLSPPKYNSVRCISISQKLADEISTQIEQRKAAENFFGNKYKRYYAEYKLEHRYTKEQPRQIDINKISDSGNYEIHLLLVRVDGTYITPRTMQHTSRVIRKDIFLDFDFHSLRHTHATNLKDIGASDKYVQERLGHVTVKTTLGYEHVSPNIENEMRKRLDEFLYKK